MCVCVFAKFAVCHSRCIYGPTAAKWMWERQRHNTSNSRCHSSFTQFNSHLAFDVRHSFSSHCQTKNIMTTTTPFTSHPLPIHTLPTLNFKLNFNLFFCVWIFFYISVGRGSFWISICLSVCLLVVHRESRLFTLLVHTIVVWSLAHQWNKFAVCINSQFRIVYRY